MKSPPNLKFISILVFSGLILLFFELKMLYNFQLLSEAVLSLTGIVIFWYTFETMSIRKAEEKILKINEELLLKTKKPIVEFKIYSNPRRKFDTRFYIENKSEYPVSIRVKLLFAIFDRSFNGPSTAYNGEGFWNMQGKQNKDGHFSLLSILTKNDFFSEENFQELKSLQGVGLKKQLNTIINFKYGVTDWPILKLRPEVYCENEFGISTYYNNLYYEFDFNRLSWMPIFVDSMRYWENSKKPTWI